MPRRGTLLTAIGTTVVAAAMALIGSVENSAANLPSSPVRRTSVPLSLPDPNGPHSGTVRGLQSGTNNRVASVESFHRLHGEHPVGRTKNRASVSAATQIHPSLGTSFDSSSVGATATQSVSTAINSSNSGTWIYAPTLFPSGGSCIEMTTAYTPRGRLLWAWDWCQSHNVARQVAIDAGFMATYTLDGNYSVQISQTDVQTNKWTAYLYNWKNKRWETFYQQSGTSPQPTGWDSYEIYSNLSPSGVSYACKDTLGKRFESQGITVKVGNDWVPADTTNSGHIYDSPQSAFHCNSLKYSMISPYSHWKAIG